MFNLWIWAQGYGWTSYPGVGVGSTGAFPIRIQSLSRSVRFGKANPGVEGQQLCHWFKSRDEIMGQDTEVRSEREWFGGWYLWPACSLLGALHRVSHPSGPAGRPPPLRMSHCSSRALTLLSSVFGACGLLLVGIAVSTDYWLYMEEGTVLPQNQTTEVKMALHAGLWRVCFFAGTGLTCPPFTCSCLAWDPRVLTHSPLSWAPEIQTPVLFLSWKSTFLPGAPVFSLLSLDPTLQCLHNLQVPNPWEIPESP